MHQFCFLQLWARAYRDQTYHAAINTTNGVESQNKLLKYSYLPRRKNITLSHLATVLYEEFVPEMHHKYLHLNYHMSAPSILVLVLVSLHVLALIGYNGTFPASTSLASSVWWGVGGGMHSQIRTREVLIWVWILQLYQSSTACHNPFPVKVLQS